MLNLTIGGYDADIDQGAEIVLSCSLTDITDPASRGAGFGLSITLPLTPRNNGIFQNLFDVKVSPNAPMPYKQKAGQPTALYTTVFSRNAKVPIVLNVKGYNVLEGNLTLSRITNAGYEVFLLQGGATWAALLQEPLQNLAMPNFCFNLATITNWNVNGDTANIVFPLLDYGNISEVVYNWDMNPIDANLLDITDFFPSTFVKPLLKKMFQGAGYTFKSDFFDLPENRDIIIPFTNELMTPIETFTNYYEDWDMLVGRNSVPIPITLGTSINGVLDTITTNIYNQTTGMPGIMVFKVDNRNICDPTKPFYYEYNFQINSNNFPISMGEALGIVVRKNGVFFANYGLPNGDAIIVGTMPMVQGDEFDYLIYYAGVNPAIPVAIINSINLAFNRIATDSQEGLIFNIAKQLPDVTQFDLLNAVMTMHNLYFTTNETAKTVTLSQYDTFIKDDFFANNILDWTNKIAPAKGFEMTFTNQNLARNVYLTYQTADDFLCTLYQDANNQKSWGNYRWQNNNQTGDLEQLVEVPVFASARGSRVPYKAVGNNQLRNRYFVRLWDIDYRNPDNITDFSFQTNWTPRILKYKYFLGIPADPYVGLLRFTYAFGTNSSTTTEEAVAYFELDNPIGRTTPSTPTDSLAFNNSNPNHVGLYERYHVAMYNRIKQSRQLDVYAYLSAADYYAIDFGKPIRINHDLFLLNAVTDWNANGNGLCKLTLIQI